MEKLRILLVDDDETLLDEFKKLLDKQEDMHVVTSASSGSKAIAIARKNPFDIAVVDITMPDLDGFDTAKELIELSPDSAIIFYSVNHVSTDIFI